MYREEIQLELLNARLHAVEKFLCEQSEEQKKRLTELFEQEIKKVKEKNERVHANV